MEGVGRMHSIIVGSVGLALFDRRSKRIDSYGG
jgi:hypothetical protein